MKKNIIKLLSLVAVAMLGWSCETDYFNEQNLDGWEPETEITDVQTVEYALVAADYAAIAGNATNKAIAEAAGEEAIAALEAIKTNGFFTSEIEAQTYIKAFVKSKYDNFFSNGSSVSISYKLSEGYPEEIKAMNAAKEYSLTSEDYAKIWEGTENGVQAVTPATINKLATVLSSEGMEAGEYMVVTYNYSTEEPKVEEETPNDPVEKEYTSVIGSAKKDDAVTIKGYISAVSAQGPIVTDNGGSLLFYDKNNGVYKDLKVGDEVTAAGTITSFNFGFQLDASKGATLEVTGTTEVKYPVPTELTGADMDALLTSRTADEYCQFVKVSGTAAVSGNYINFNVPGAEKAVGSIYGATDAVKAELTNGRECTVYGYFTSISKSSGNPKFVNLVVVSVDKAPAIDPGNDYTSVIGSAKKDDAVTIKGYISAVSAQGPIVTDNGGSLLFYDKNNGVYKDLKVGDEVTAAGTITSFNFGFQLDASKGATLEVTGTTEVKYPVPTELTGADMDALLTSRTADEYCQFVKVSGTAAVSGNYINFNVPGAEKAVGSIYGATDAVKAELTNGRECTVYGYFTSISKSSGNPKFVNIVVTKVEDTTTAAKAATATVQSKKQYAYYQWDGTTFKATDIVAVQPDDYTEMGLTNGNFSNATHDTYIPKFLNKQLPYATEGTAVRVAYRYYQNNTTSFVVDEYIYDGTTWARNLNIEVCNAPFKKLDGEWIFDPSMTITLNPDKSEFSKKYYMAAFEWVYNNKHTAYTFDDRQNKRTEDAEYYSGCAAGYTNLNWRINTLPKYYWGPAGDDVTPYENWSAEDPAVAKACFEAFYAECEKRFGEVMAAALGTIHSNQRMIDGMDIIYTVQLKVYANAENLPSSLNDVTHAFEFKVIGDGQFEYVRMYALDPKYDLYLDFN